MQLTGRETMHKLRSRPNMPHCLARPSVCLGRHLEGKLKGSTDPQGFNDFNFFPVNSSFETVLLLQEQYDT